MAGLIKSFLGNTSHDLCLPTGVLTVVGRELPALEGSLHAVDSLRTLSCLYPPEKKMLL